MASSQPKSKTCSPDAGLEKARTKASIRARMIARTASKRAEQFGLVEAIREAEVEEIVWVTESGACEFCRALEGTVVKTGNAFVRMNRIVHGDDGGELKNEYDTLRFPPLHPNCRCSVQPFVRRRR